MTYRFAAEKLAALALCSLCLAGSLAAQAGNPSRRPGNPGAGGSRVFEALDPAVEFLLPYGLDNFSTHYVTALSTLLGAREDFDAGRYDEAKARLDALWLQYPTGGLHWNQLPSQPFGINIGSPPCYYALRMLSDATDWHVANPAHENALRTVRLTVILVGHSNGVEPRNLFELSQGTGVQVQHDLEPALLQNDSRIVHESLELFRQYVVGMSEGTLEVETRILHLPDADLPVHATLNGSSFYAGLEDASQIWPLVPPADLDETDWWWILYPSHVPEQHPDFVTQEFITGGMGVGPESGSPFFIIDDRWLTRKPPHIGTGPYSKIERNTYLPQWLQHEFFHHLFRIYPEFGLEATSHQWFNPANWPADFEGRYEPDYYHEALYRRLQGASTPLVAALRYSNQGAPWDQFTLADVLGTYTRMPVQNNWHIGDIQNGPQLEWQNQAGVDWNLNLDLSRGKLFTGPDCPYFGSWNGNKFDLVLQRNDMGDLLPEILGFSFNGELYSR